MSRMLPSIFTSWRAAQTPAPAPADPFGLNAALAERKAARPARQAAAKRGREARK